jgi:hypothetical protein
MAGLTGDAREMEGVVGITGVSSVVQAAVVVLPADELPGDGPVHAAQV